MIDLKDIHKFYPMGNNKLHVLKGIDLFIAEGEMVAIMGSSGSGKSTLLNIIGILDGYDTGHYTLSGTPIVDLTETEAARYRNKFLGFVFQAFNLIGYKSALENVALPLYYQRISRSKRNTLAQTYLEKVGLGDRSEHLPGELSGGQKQRVAIARALITNPSVLLADEPTGALDTQTSLDVMKLLRDINQSGKTVVIVTHEPDIAAMCDRVIFLRDGVVVEDRKNRHEPV
jgi:putative ABC transport system ATP-binding protein